MKRLFALLRQRCPVCLQGHVFKGLFGMHSHCPVCGVKYERETGYFLNSMFIAYTAGFFILVPTAVLLYFLNVDLLVFSTAIILETVIIYPLLFPLLAPGLDARRPGAGSAHAGDVRPARPAGAICAVATPCQHGRRKMNHAGICTVASP